VKQEGAAAVMGQVHHIPEERSECRRTHRQKHRRLGPPKLPQSQGRAQQRLHSKAVIGLGSEGHQRAHRQTGYYHNLQGETADKREHSVVPAPQSRDMIQ
jgi:hypothetical protein